MPIPLNPQTCPSSLWHASCSYTSHPCHCLNPCHSLAGLQTPKSKDQAGSLALSRGPCQARWQPEVRVLLVQSHRTSTWCCAGPVRKSDPEVCSSIRSPPSSPPGFCSRAHRGMEGAAQSPDTEDKPGTKHSNNQGSQIPLFLQPSCCCCFDFPRQVFRVALWLSWDLFC